MNDESRPFGKGPFHVQWHPDDPQDLPHPKGYGWTIWDGEGRRIKRLGKMRKAEAEQLRLALELLELLPEIERALYTTEGRPEIVSKLAALKEPRP